MYVLSGTTTEVEAQLRGGRLACPDCGGRLRPWGSARTRQLRSGGRWVRLRPRRARCAGCCRTHVLLPAGRLGRRLDRVETIGAALCRAAAGAGSRRIARPLGLPPTTVRDWIRRWRHAVRAGRPDPVAACPAAPAEAAAYWRRLSAQTRGQLLKPPPTLPVGGHGR